MASVIRTAICRRRSRPQGGIGPTMATAATPCHAAMALTSIAGTAYVTRTEQSRRSIRRGVSDTTATGTGARRNTTIGTEPSARRKQPNLRWPEPLRPAQFCDSFGHHRDQRSHGVRLRQPSERRIGLGAAAGVRIVMRGRKDAANGEVLIYLPCGIDAI